MADQALAVGWPRYAVAGTVGAVDMEAQRDSALINAQWKRCLAPEERRFVERSNVQPSADTQVTPCNSLILEGHDPPSS